MKILMIFAVRYRTTRLDQYNETTKLVNFRGDISLFFTKEIPMNVHLQAGQRYWLPDMEHPYYHGGSIREGFNDYVIEESGYLTLNGRGLPYCVISETDHFSNFDPMERWDKSKIGNQSKEKLWRKYIAEQIRYHRKSFQKFGWKRETKLPPA